LLGSADGFESPSEEPGRDEFREFAANRAFNSTISALSSATNAASSS
jgi:hypothetical protein